MSRTTEQPAPGQQPAPELQSAEPSGAEPSGAEQSGAEQPTNDRTTRRRRRTILLVVLAVLVVAAVVIAVVAVRSAAETPAEAVAATAPVPVRVAHVPDGTKIGVVVTLGDGEGSEWADAAQGALVAQRRLQLGGTTVQLVAQDDAGSTDGARAAVEALAKQGVAGIVVASSGRHVDGAFAAASSAGIPVVAPYAAGSDDAWSTAPSTDSTASAMRSALGSAKSPLLVDLGGGAPSGLQVAHVVDAVRDADTAALATTIAERTGVAAQTADTTTGSGADAPVAADSDAVVLSGPAARQGALVAALQSADVTAPIILTADATSPTFAAALTQAGGSLSGGFRTVGVETDDARALHPDATGRSMSAFLGGLRVLADDADAKNLTGDRPFSSVAPVADARSHDAVIALVRAVGTARSDEPSAVADALATLDLSGSDGLAGPDLVFRTHEAMRSPASVLASSAQDLGLRPAASDDSADASGSPSLVWFADDTER
ncbi:ABC transporter substrate-binding protein [Curtobacterium sp. C1]|uniref:ABC transporter substrate-binding protein n=1 Tax=Curtobacterium sp. C1 TaxID=2898151 RepID=UPI001E2FD7B9|nr:ABC transporter substrate-binding protein [Curtobacterium sp. C1]UFU13756.1 ABC transporter substrate-binding protein [Curtobacterium sp. C1]